MRISRSVVSDRVRQLESLIGGQLLHRTTRRTTLSELGERLFPGYRDTVHCIDDLENAVPALRQSLGGRLRVVSVTDIGIHTIAPAIAEFATLHGDLAIELITENRVVNPIEAGFDVAIHVRQGLASDVDEILIATIPSVYCAAPAYLADRPAIVEPRDLLAHVCVNYSLQPNLNEWLFHRGDETVSVHVRFRLSSNSGQILRGFAVAGHGVAVLPRYRVAADLAAGRLVALVPDWQPPELRLTATVP